MSLIKFEKGKKLNTIRIFSVAVLFSFVLSACEQNSSSTNGSSTEGAENVAPQVQTQTPASTAPAVEHTPTSNAPAAAANAFSNTLSGEVLETFDASTFTYVQIKTSNGLVWAAGPVTAIKKGDTVSFDGKTPMENFHSKSLNRSFEMIYFANSFKVNG